MRTREGLAQPVHVAIIGGVRACWGQVWRHLYQWTPCLLLLEAVVAPGRELPQKGRSGYPCHIRHCPLVRASKCALAICVPRATMWAAGSRLYRDNDSVRAERPA